MQMGFMGGAMEIGGSSIYLRADGKGILLDAGIRQGEGKDPIPDFRMVQRMGGVDAILVSHAHMDHTGTLPLISKAYPAAPVYMTAMTADLVRVLLADSLKIMNRSEGEIPHYTQEDVAAMLNRIHALNFCVRFPIFEGMAVTMYPAGHIAGAACIYLECNEGTIFYSGDFCAFPQKTIEGIHIPKLRPDAAIVETTYGDRLHANRQVEENGLVNLVAECVARGDKVLIPAFALGRAQEVLLLLKGAIQNGQIPSVPVYADGMVRDINGMYERNPAYLRRNLGRSVWKGNAPFYTREITAVAPMEDRDELISRKGAAVFVASSGMLNGGPSVLYAKKIAPMENGCIIITGYQDEESPGRKLTELLEEMDHDSRDTEPTITLDGITVPVRCRIYRTGLSAHGDQGEIEGLLERLSPRDLFLVHGDRAVIESFGKNLKQDYRQRVYLPECGEVFALNYVKKRKQLTENFQWSLQRQGTVEGEGERLLWQYVREHYPQKALTCEQLFFIWSGKKGGDEQEGADKGIKDMEEKLRNSPYFSADTRRLFLFHANSEEEVSANLAPKEWTAQQLEEVIREEFSGFLWKKVSFYAGERKVLLNFDFPDAVDMVRFEECKKEFCGKTGWNIEIAPSMNFMAASLLLTELFGQRILKTSYFTEKKAYEVKLSGKDAEDDARARRFTESTGWLLRLPGVLSGVALNISGEGSGMDDFRMFLPESSVGEPVEQNLALYCVEKTFEGKGHRIYKKSIRSDSQGKYLELTFLSPEVGRRYGEILAQLAKEIQWRIAIGDSVNQNGVFEEAGKICSKYGIVLRQNPSYLPQKRMVQLKASAPLSEDMIENVSEDIKQATGLECLIIY